MQSLKKKLKDGWMPILLSMQGDVAHMINEWDLQVWTGGYEWAVYLHNVAGEGT